MTNLEKLYHYCSDFESPEQFIVWSYLFSIAACLERKVWYQGGLPFYPNEQIVFVGPPSVGKSIVARQLLNEIKSLYKEIPGSKIIEPLIKVAPTSVTQERLYEILERVGSAVGKDVTGDKPYFHSSLSIILPGEMGSLFKAGPQADNLTMFLNDGYDCEKKFEYETKRSGQNHLTNLCVNLFACTTPDWVEKNLDSAVIGNGWSSRVLWIYGGERRQLTTFFNFSEAQEKNLADLKSHFRTVAKLYGEVKMTPECSKFYDEWYQKDPSKNRINNDSKLDHYYGRKRTHTIKVAMLVHFAEKTNMVIDLEDFKLALKLLAIAEVDMHKALAGVNSNPTSKLATDMLRFVTQKDSTGATLAEIIGEMFGRTPRGMEAIDEAKEYLRITEQIKQGAEGKWFVNKKIVPVSFVGGKSAELKTEVCKRQITPEEIKEAAYGK